MGKTSVLKIKRPSKNPDVIFGLGIDRLTLKPLFPAVKVGLLLSRLKKRFEIPTWRRKKGNITTAKHNGKRGVYQVPASVNLNDPRDAGWTYLYREQDPLIKKISGPLEELSRHRAMTGGPMVYRGGNQASWLDWLREDYLKRPKKPKYVLIIGGSDQVPFSLQSLLSSFLCVGRISFDDPKDYENYIQKIISLEKAGDGIVQREAFFFATDHHDLDPTHYCCANLIAPLMDFTRDKLSAAAYGHVGKAATRQAFISSQGSNASVVFVAAHGLANAKDLEKENGAIYCPERQRKTFAHDDFVFAGDIDQEQKWFQGSVFFHFGCFSYGTPARSDIIPLITGVKKRYHPTGFVAALPKKLLSHISGPIAYIGHLDTAYMNGFIAPKTQKELNKLRENIGSYTSAMKNLLEPRPVGRALEAMNRESVLFSNDVLDTYDEWNANVDGIIRRLHTMDHSRKKKALESWIRRNNTRNFMLLGDPGARLSIWKDDRPEVRA